MIYSYKHESFSLTSIWSCSSNTQSNGQQVWRISYGPTQSSKSLDYPVSLPADAVIKRAWLQVTLGSPLSGAKKRTINGDSLPASGIYEISNISAATTSWSAAFAFKANGKVYQDTATHQGTLNYGSPTLNIEYTSDSSGGSDEGGEGGSTILPGGSIIRDANGGLQLPRLLNRDLSEQRRLYPDKCSITLNIQPLHNATMHIPPVVPPGAPTFEVPVRSFVELFTPIGSAGIYRVSDTETSYGSDAGQTLYLESALSTLTDDLVIGVQAMTGTVAEVFSTLLEAQTTKYWVLGDCEIPDEYELIYDHAYDNILEAITKLLGMLPDEYYMDLDTLTIPFQMHIRKLPAYDGCEMRLSRNLQSLRVTMDSRNLCTRVYPFGSGEGTDRIGLSSLTGAQYMDSDTVRTWGVVAKTFTEEDIYDSITLQDVATRYLEKNKDPVLSIEAKAMELSKVTGLSWDRFTLGKRCRVSLPEYRDNVNKAIVFSEIIISQEWDNVYGDPENVRLTLANKVRTAADEIAGLMREATSSKLIGGSVSTEEDKSNANDITTDKPYVHYFDISEYGNILAIRLSFVCTDMDTGLTTSSVKIAVDGTTVENTNTKGNVIDILPYIEKDESGIPTVGEHRVRIAPNNSQGWYRVSSTVIIKKIERK